MRPVVSSTAPAADVWVVAEAVEEPVAEAALPLAAPAVDAPLEAMAVPLFIEVARLVMAPVL